MRKGCVAYVWKDEAIAGDFDAYKPDAGDACVHGAEHLLVGRKKSILVYEAEVIHF